MTTLIVLGNINKYTFANSIVAANQRAVASFNSALTDIVVIHSRDSYIKLTEQQDWITHLEANGIRHDKLTHRELEIESTTESLEQFIAYLERIVKGQPEGEPTIVDLTNGTTLHKTFLSIVAYILDLQHLYAIDIIKLSALTQSRQYIDADILFQSYTLAPSSAKLDTIAYLNLAEVIRYKNIIEQHKDRYVAIHESSADEEFFRDNLIHSIRLKLEADQKTKTDKAVYRIASSAISASIEDLLRVMIEKFSIGNAEGRTFGQNLQAIQQRVEKDPPPEFDLEFFHLFNRFMLYLRNSSTHKGRLLTDLEKFKAELSVKFAFPFIQFYTDIVHDALARNEQSIKPTRIQKLDVHSYQPTDTMYYGLDGDNTGSLIEELFCLSSDERSFQKLSRKITDAVTAVGKVVRKEKGASVIFEAGDDLLFKGIFSYASLKAMQQLYFDESGMTCSIGYGSSFKEVYLALKSAKTEPGKNAIVGIKFT